MSNDYITELEPYQVLNGNEYLVTDGSGKLYAGKWFRDLLSNNSDEHVTVGSFDDPVRGADEPARIDYTQLYRHLAIFGRAGTGKSTLAESIVHQILAKGGAACYFNIKGDASFNFAQKLPDDVFVDSDRYQYLDPTTHDIDSIDYDTVIADGQLLVVAARKVSADKRAEVLTEVTTLLKNARIDGNRDNPCVVVADDVGLYGDDIPAEFMDTLSVARSLKMGFIMALQAPEDLEDGLNHEMFAHVDSLLTFNPGDQSAAGKLAQRYNIGANRLLDLKNHEFVMRFLQGGAEKSELFNIETIPPLPPRRSEDSLGATLQADLKND
jgi:molybdopterin-guanine dinucleotide biosynthesis protein